MWRTYRNAIEILISVGIKLEANAETVCSACHYLHKFRRHYDCRPYDPLLMAATALYLAAKVEENHLRLRDIINAFHAAIHKSDEPLECDDKYWTLRDSVVKCELLLLRMLRFRVSVLLPHRYLNVYLKSLRDWIADRNVSDKLSLTCWALLNDYYCLDERCINYPPNHIAISAIELSLRCHNYRIPHNDEALLSWSEALDESLTRHSMQEIMEQILDAYDDSRQEQPLSSAAETDFDFRAYVPQHIYDYRRTSP